MPLLAQHHNSGRIDCPAIHPKQFAGGRRSIGPRIERADEFFDE
jgi:hypothetical protein